MEKGESIRREIRQLDELIAVAPETMVEDLCEHRMDLQEQLAKLQKPAVFDQLGFFCDSNIMI
jgi:hypothetical protein